MRFLRTALAACLWAVAMPAADMPHLRKQGTATQLIVDGKPFLMLAGELHNSSASSLEYMKPVWDKLVALHLNTVLAPVSWELLEPEEGKFDFSLVDGLIQDARKRRLHLVFLWFGSWKNGVSTYPPLWVKTNPGRFARARDRNGRSFDVLSPLGEASRDADARAFAALMRHIREVDEGAHTVVMVQVENEVGLLGDSRDRSPLAEKAWRMPVPAELIDYLRKNKATLIPEFAQAWEAHGFRTSGAWADLFGDNAAGDEVFMAWHLARYIGRVVSAGKAAYPLPMYVNAWLVQSPGETPGSYPSGGPVSKMLDVWRAAAPAIDLLAPDIYLPDFKGVCASYNRSGNPLFIPEADNSAQSAANAFYAVAQHDALGFSPFAIDDLEPSHPVGASFDILSELAPLVAEHNGRGTMAGILQGGEPGQTIALGGYRLTVGFEKRGGFGLAVSTGPDEFLAAGSGFEIGFALQSQRAVARIGWIDEGRFVAGKWVPGRRLNGDETGGGTRLILPAGRIGIQKVKLYRVSQQ